MPKFSFLTGPSPRVEPQNDVPPQNTALAYPIKNHSTTAVDMFCFFGFHSFVCSNACGDIPTFPNRPSFYCATGKSLASSVVKKINRRPLELVVFLLLGDLDVAFPGDNASASYGFAGGTHPNLYFA